MSRAERRAGLLALTGGILLAAVAGILGPRSVLPLYDGVVPLSPYVWLSPPPGQLGGVKGVTDTLQVSGGASPLVAVHTSEQPPQAQLVAGPGALVLPPGTTSITVSIEPVAPAVAPSDGQVAGNVYRVSVTTQSGATVIARSDAEVTLTLRSPSGITPSWFELLSGGTWQVLESAQAGYPSTYETTGLTGFGDFALIARGGSSGPLATITGPFALVIGIVIVLGAILATILVLRPRRRE
jgi:hypothetical protein